MIERLTRHGYSPTAKRRVITNSSQVQPAQKRRRSVTSNFVYSLPSVVGSETSGEKKDTPSAFDMSDSGSDGEQENGRRPFAASRDAKVHRSFLEM